MDFFQSLLDGIAQSHPLLQFLVAGISAAFTEEAATTIVFGLAAKGKITWIVATSAVFFGTFIMNFVIWWMGRQAGERILHWKMFAKLEGPRLDSLRSQVNRRGWMAVALARLVPGTRLPVFALAGALGMSQWSYLLTQLLTSLLWLVGMVYVSKFGLMLAEGSPHRFALGAIVVVALAIAISAFRSRSKPST